MLRFGIAFDFGCLCMCEGVVARLGGKRHQFLEGEQRVCKATAQVPRTSGCTGLMESNGVTLSI